MVINQSKYAHCVPSAGLKHRRKVPFQPVIRVPASSSAKFTSIHRLDEELHRFVLRQDDYVDLIVEAWAMNFHSSTKLEGNPLSLDDAQRITRDSWRGRINSNAAFPIQEFYNHWAIWLVPEIFKHPWNIDMVRTIHALVMLGAGPEVLPGQFRQAEGVVTGPDGQEWFIGAPPKYIEEELSGLLDWLNTQAPAVSPVAAAAVFFHEFESIHPFLDGNGRVGRVLFHLYLQTHGLPNSHLCMIEKELSGNPEPYYRVLGWTDQTGQYTDLVEYATDAVILSYENARDRLRTKDLMSSNLAETPQKLVKAAKLHGDWFKANDASRWIERLSAESIRNHLNDLTQKGVLEAVGETRARMYRFRHPLHRVERYAVAITLELEELLREIGPRLATMKPKDIALVVRERFERALKEAEDDTKK
ncbi:MAG: Fic family protein [Euryarchaeota archaeon]|nr:Fic family protein [Euryarchaeota archaeon]